MNTFLLLAALMTAEGARVTPENAWRDYPRPQMVRANWTCLNGLWDYTITSNVNHLAVEVQKGQILVDLFYETYAESVINGAIQVNVYVVG